MFVQDINLNVDYEALGLKRPEKAPTFTGYILKNYDEYCKDRIRPAVIICPGGGYAYTSDREATPMATEFLAAGMCAFVLRYSCMPSKFPTALVELATAVPLGDILQLRWAFSGIRMFCAHGDLWTRCTNQMLWFWLILS